MEKLWPKVLNFLHYINRYTIVRFIYCAILVTLIDGAIFFLMSEFFNLVISNMISYSIAVFAAFYLHKKFVFIIRVKTSIAFLFMLLFSLLGIVVSTLVLILFNLFFESLFEAKFLTILTMAAYGFTTKKIAFRGVLKNKLHS